MYEWEYASCVKFTTSAGNKINSPSSLTFILSVRSSRNQGFEEPRAILLL